MVVHRTETSVWELVSAASWYAAEFWTRTPAVLRVVGTTTTSVSTRSTPQDLLLRRLIYDQLSRTGQQINLAANLQCRAPCLVLQFSFGTQVMTVVPVSTTFVMTFAPDKSEVDLQVDSVRKAFALQCEVPTTAMTLDSKPRDGCPS